MRALLLLPAAVLVVALSGLALCGVANWSSHPRELLVAAGICLAASALAAVPMILTRGASQSAVSQAGLVATLLHMMCCLAAAGVALLGKLPLATAFIYWLAAMYWATLAALVAALVRMVRTAVPHGKTEST